MRQRIILREVGLRDGLQIHPTFMPSADKLAWSRKAIPTSAKRPISNP